MEKQPAEPQIIGSNPASLHLRHSIAQTTHGLSAFPTAPGPLLPASDMEHRNIIPHFKPNIGQPDQGSYQSAIISSQAAHSQALAAGLAHISSLQPQQAQIQANRVGTNGTRNPTLPQRIAPQPTFISPFQNTVISLDPSFGPPANSQAPNFNFAPDALFASAGQGPALVNKKILLPKRPSILTKRPPVEEKNPGEKDTVGPGGKIRALRTTHSEMAKVERAQTEELSLQIKDPSIERAARKNIRLRRAAEKAELRAQMEAIQQNRYRPVYYYQPPVQSISADPTGKMASMIFLNSFKAEATTFNGRYRKIVPKDTGSFPQHP